MAIIVPNLRLGHAKVTTGERRFAARLEHLLEDDYWCFYDIPVGKRRRYPDFIILHPRRGLLFLEVKDWRLRSIEGIDHQKVDLQTAGGLKAKVNPVEQARQGAYQTIDMLRYDPELREQEGRFKGNLICPYGYGVVLTNITRRQIQATLPGDVAERVLPGHLLICQDEMLEDTDPEAFQERLWGMFNYQFERGADPPRTRPDPLGTSIPKSGSTTWTCSHRRSTMPYPSRISSGSWISNRSNWPAVLEKVIASFTAWRVPGKP